MTGDRAFRSLDFIYTPSHDVPGDMAFASEILGGEIVFAIDGMGTRVAAVKLSDNGPLVLFADHVEGDRPVLVYRVDDLAAARNELAANGCTIDAQLEIPHSPIATVTGPGGHRFAVYELTRPEAGNHFNGRRDF